MSVMELLASRRTYRRFAQKPVPQDVVGDIVEAVRLSSCGANRQALRLVVVQSPEMVANMTLAAWDKEVGSCIMGAINKPALTELLGIEEPLKLAYMVAFGYPTHKAHIVPLTADTGVKYYLDENRDYCVPKRSAEEIARSV